MPSRYFAGMLSDCAISAAVAERSAFTARQVMALMAY
jgi:hypothetical protein